MKLIRLLWHNFFIILTPKLFLNATCFLSILLFIWFIITHLLFPGSCWSRAKALKKVKVRMPPQHRISLICFKQCFHCRQFSMFGLTFGKGTERKMYWRGPWIRPSMWMRQVFALVSMSRIAVTFSNSSLVAEQLVCRLRWNGTALSDGLLCSIWSAQRSHDHWQVIKVLFM